MVFNFPAFWEERLY